MIARTVAVLLAGLHVASTRSVGMRSRTYVRQLFR